MNKKNKGYKLNYLSSAFYEKYKAEKYHEIEHKENRPYMVMVIEIDSNTFAVPFRTNVKHNNCYKFKKSSRETNSVTGLDYTKAVIVNDTRFIGESARINDMEYTELDINYHKIIARFTTFVRGYIKFANGKLNEHQAKNYKYTTLKYFHKELGLSDKE